MAAAPLPPTPPFVARELNGTTLIEEVHALRDADVRQKDLTDCALAVRRLGTSSVADAAARFRHLATGRFHGQPTLASLLVRWATKLRSDGDVPLLVAHLERLALVGALVPATRKATDRLGLRGRKR